MIFLLDLDVSGDPDAAVDQLSKSIRAVILQQREEPSPGVLALERDGSAYRYRGRVVGPSMVAQLASLVLEGHRATAAAAASAETALAARKEDRVLVAKATGRHRAKAEPLATVSFWAEDWAVLVSRLDRQVVDLVDVVDQAGKAEAALLALVELLGVGWGLSTEQSAEFPQAKET